MTDKIKKTQPEDLKGVQGRDLFQTPNYATELLVPFIPKHIDVIWECANGKGKISDILRKYGYSVVCSDLADGNGFNFLTQDIGKSFQIKAIITNPPFSLKSKFYNRCKEYNVPFALLIPADYSGWLIDAIRFDGCEKIIPTRRIDYITPSGLSGKTGNTSNFHSFWLTWGFNLGRSETFVELTNKMKENI